MSKIPEDKIDEILKRYQAGEKPEDLSKEYKIHSNSITRLARKKGVTRQLQRVSEENCKLIIDRYIDGTSSEIIAKDFGINGSTVCRILKRNNIAIRPSELNKRKYNIDQNFFENIDTEAKAYFLGFLYADGSLRDGGVSITLNLHPQDKDVLEKFSNLIYNFIKIRSVFRKHKLTQTLSEYCEFIIYSKKMHTDLQKLGCTPDKAFAIRFNKDMLSPELIRHFFRGYFDGDGCICLANKSRPVIDITSNKDFIQDIRDYLEPLLNIKFNKTGQRHEDTDTRNIQISSMDNVKIFLDYLYRDSTIYMDRKFGYYNDFLNLYQLKQGNKINKFQNISNYGTIYIPMYEGNLLNSKYLESIDDNKKDIIVNYLFDFYREYGFPFPQYTNDELICDFNNLSKLDPNENCTNNVLRIFNMAGLSFFKHFNPHFFEVKSGLKESKPSMLESFNDDECLKKIIKNRVYQNFNMSGNMLRQGMANSSLAFKASIFSPLIAKFIYNKFCKEGDIIYDYSMGFGQRLLAALSLPFKVTYIGVDPLEKSVEGNQNTFDFLKTNIPMFDKEVDIICDKSEDYCDPKYIGKVNVAFSSPPYFNQEIYEDSNNQAYSSGSYCEFINNWWRKTMNNIDKLLVDDGLFIINVKDEIGAFNLSKDMINVARELGYTLIDTYYIQLNKNLVFKNKDSKDKLEPIYVLKKGSK